MRQARGSRETRPKASSPAPPGSTPDASAPLSPANESDSALRRSRWFLPAVSVLDLKLLRNGLCSYHRFFSPSMSAKHWGIPTTDVDEATSQSRDKTQLYLVEAMFCWILPGRGHSGSFFV